MAKLAGRACRSVWERRAPRWLAGLGAALVVAVVVGVGGASPVSAGPPPPCIPDVPSYTSLPTMSEARGVAGGTLTTTRSTWEPLICGGGGTVTYAWQRSTNGGTTWSNISPTVSTLSYSPTSADVDNLVREEDTACNIYGCSYADSPSSAIYESALGLRRQYTSVANVQVDDQESLQVDPADGNLVVEANDFSLPGIAGFGYAFTRSYNSAYSTLSPASGDFSNPNPLLATGWEDVANLSLFNLTGGPNTGDARYTDPSGYEITFKKSGSTFTAPPGSDATLVLSGSNYLLTFYKTGMQDKFNASGQLIDEYDRNGNTIAFSWSGSPSHLSTVTDTTGRTTTFHYTSGNMTSITTPCAGAPMNLAGAASSSGGSLGTGTYFYEVTAVSSGRESTVSSENSESVAGPTGSVALTWNPVAGASSYRIYRGTSAGGENTYYTSSTTSYTDTGSAGASGSPPAPAGMGVYSYTYSGGQLATFTDPTGATTTYTYNASGLLSKVQNPLGHGWTIAYDSKNRVSSITGNRDRFATPTGTASSSGGSLATGTYYFEVSAIAGGREVRLSNERSTAVTGPSGEVTLTWSAVPGAASYRVYRGTSSGAENVYHATSSTSYTDTGGGTTGSPWLPKTSFTYTQAPTTLCATGTETDVADVYTNTTKYCTDGRARVYESKDPLSHTTSSDFTDTTHGGTNCVDSSGATLDDQPCSTTDPLGTTQYGYDSTGQNQLWEQNPLQTASHRSTWAYGASAHPYYATSYTDADGNPTTYSYTTAGNVCTREDGAGNTTLYTYDSSGDGELISEQTGLTATSTCPSGTLTCPAICPTTQYGYDTSGNETSMIDGRNKTTAYGYDSAGNQTSETDPLGHSTYSTYDADGRSLSQTDPLGNMTEYVYDAAGNQTSETDGLNSSGTCPSGATCPLTATAYSVNNQPLSVTDPNTHTTYYNYDADGNQVTETDPDGNQTSSVYDANGDVTSTTDGLDSSGTCPSGATCPMTSYTYDADGNELTEIDPDNNETKYTYDAIGDQLSERDGLTSSGSCASGTTCPTTTYSYDLAGNQTKVVDGNLRQTSTTYDGDNRTSTVISGLDSSSGTCPTSPSGVICPETVYSYDNNGNPATVTQGDSANLHDAQTTQTVYTYNADNQQSAITTGYQWDSSTSAYDCVGGASCPGTSFTYYDDGSLHQTTDPNGNTTTDTYYDNGWLDTTTDPMSNVTTDNYDNVGSLISVQTPKGTTTSCYDPTGHLTSTYYSSATCGSGTPDVSYTYDHAGNQLTMSTAGTYGVTTQTSHYTNLELPDWISTSEPISGSTLNGTFNYTYNGNGDITSDEYPDGTTTYYNYNNQDLMCRVGSSSASDCTTSPMVTYSYDGDGNLNISTHPSGYGNFTETRNYDNANRLDEVNTSNSSTTLDDFSYTLNDAGNPTAIARSGPSLSCNMSYFYDNNDRLTSSNYSSCPGSGQPTNFSWTYDAAGNMTESTADSTSTYYLPNADEQICAYSTSGPPSSCGTGYTYDGNGNETTDAVTGNTYQYNLANDITSISSGSTTSYTYDGEENQLSMAAGGSATYYFWDYNSPDGTPQLALEENSSGTVTQRYLYGLNRLSTTDVSGGTTDYYAYDGSDSVSDLITSVGAIDGSDTYSYNPYGGLRTAPPPNLAFDGASTIATVSSPSLYMFGQGSSAYDSSTGRTLNAEPATSSSIVCSLPLVSKVCAVWHDLTNADKWWCIAFTKQCVIAFAGIGRWANDKMVHYENAGILESWDGGTGAAFRHCFWQAWMTLTPQIGASMATDIGFNHEWKVIQNRGDLADAEMGLHNNQVGRSIGANAPNTKVGVNHVCHECLHLTHGGYDAYSNHLWVRGLGGASGTSRDRLYRADGYRKRGAIISNANAYKPWGQLLEYVYEQGDEYPSP